MGKITYTYNRYFDLKRFIASIYPCHSVKVAFRTMSLFEFMSFGGMISWSFMECPAAANRSGTAVPLMKLLLFF